MLFFYSNALAFSESAHFILVSLYPCFLRSFRKKSIGHVEKMWRKIPAKVEKKRLFRHRKIKKVKNYQIELFFVPNKFWKLTINVWWTIRCYIGDWKFFWPLLIHAIDCAIREFMKSQLKSEGEEESLFGDTNMIFDGTNNLEHFFSV